MAFTYTGSTNIYLGSGVVDLGSVFVDGYTTQANLAGNKTFTGVHLHSNTLAATSTSTGALVVTGGAGIGGNCFIGGNLYITGSVTTLNGMSSGGGGNVTFSGGTTTNTVTVSNTTPSTSTSTGALQVTGGVGIGGNAFVGGNFNVSGTVTLPAGSVATTALAGTFLDNASNQTGFAGNKTFTGILAISNATASTSTSTGALVVSGGTGVGGNVYVGGSLFTNNVAIGTFLSNNVNSLSVVTSTWYNAGQLSLTQGTWIINFNVYCTGTPAYFLIISISSTSATRDANNTLILPSVSPGWAGPNLTRIVQVSSTTTWYGTFYFENAGISSIGGYLTAVKIA